jgi:hypothetical protein
LLKNILEFFLQKSKSDANISIAGVLISMFMPERQIPTTIAATTAVVAVRPEPRDTD